MKRKKRGLYFTALLLLALSSGCGGTFQLAPGVRIDRIVIEKAERRMTLYQGTERVGELRVGIGRPGDKEHEGDRRTPEGEYVIDRRHRSRRFIRFLHISYPNREDRLRYSIARRSGRVPRGEDGRFLGIGFAIGIHGTGGRDWIPRLFWSTAGCIMVSDEEAILLFERIAPRTRVEILP